MVTLHDALEYHDRGLAIIPIRAGTKKPSTGWKKFQSAGPSESQVRRWFGDNDQTALAAIMGKVSGGLVCRDFDDMGAYERWRTEHPDLAQTLPTVETGRPGRHVYAVGDIGQIQAASKSGGTIIEFDDGELRGGGYCLLPPSIHPDGPVYRWLAPLSDELPKIDLKAAGFIPCNRENGDDRSKRRELRPLSQCPVSSRLALSSLLHERIDYAIAATLPVRAGKRNAAIFEFARALKAFPEFVDGPVGQLRPHINRWHAAALPVIGTKPFDETWFDFARAWRKAKFPKGQEPIAMMFAKASEAAVPEVAEQYETPALRLLVAWCRELQRTSGDGPFFLDCRTAGEKLGVDHATAWRWLDGLQTDQILQLVESGSHAKHRANRYRYLPPL